MPARGRLYAAWLAAHGLLALLPVTSHGYLDWQPFNPWVMHLEANIEGTLANTYTVVLWGVAGALALAQATRADGRRYLWLGGWICIALIAWMIAAEEHIDLKSRLGIGVALLEWIPGSLLWLAVISPLLIMLIPMSVYVLYTSVQRHAVLAILAAIASACGIAAVVHELAHDMHLSYNWLLIYEEGLEMISAALICVVLVELLVRHRYAITAADKRT